MPFQKGNKIGRGNGGAKPGAGRKTKAWHHGNAIAKDIAKAYIEASIKPVLHQYYQLAAGRMVNKYHEGKVVGQEFEADAPTTRHFIDKVLPEEKDKGEKDNRPLVWNIVLQGSAAKTLEINTPKQIEPPVFTFDKPDEPED